MEFMDKGKLGVIFLVFFGLLLVLSFSKRGIYSQTLGINLVLVGELKVSILAIRPKEGIVNWTDLPGNLSVKIYKTGVFYPVLSLWKLGQSEKDQFNYVTKSLTMATGLSLPKVIWVGKETSPESLLRALGSLMAYTNLSWRDRILLRKDLTNFVAAKKIVEVELPGAAIEKVVEPDGKEVVTFNSILALWNKNKFLVEAILGEAISARINNLSDAKGMGVLLSKELEAAGVRVVEVVSRDEPLKESKSGCYYLFGKGNNKITEEYFRNHLDCVARKDDLGIHVDLGEVYLWIF